MAASEQIPEINRQNIRMYFRMSPDPFVNSRELAEYFGVTRQTVNNYLGEMEEDEEVYSKDCGSAQGWWLSDNWRNISSANDS